jgi:hypothetical protein
MALGPEEQRPPSKVRRLESAALNAAEPDLSLDGFADALRRGQSLPVSPTRLTSQRLAADVRPGADQSRIVVFEDLYWVERLLPAGPQEGRVAAPHWPENVARRRPACVSPHPAMRSHRGPYRVRAACLLRQDTRRDAGVGREGAGRRRPAVTPRCPFR